MFNKTLNISSKQAMMYIQASIDTRFNDFENTIIALSRNIIPASETGAMNLE